MPCCTCSRTCMCRLCCSLHASSRSRRIGMAEMGLFEAMYTARALRRLKPDPVPDEIIAKVIDAGIRAASGANNQNWIFVVIKDPDKRARIGELYRRAGQVFMEMYRDA